MNSNARLIAPIRPASGTAQRARSGGAGATISNAASGSPSRLGCAQSTQAISASAGRRHDRFRLLARGFDDEIAQHALVELHGTLVLRQQVARRLVLGDDVIARVLLLDLECHRSLAPVGHVRKRTFAFLGQKAVKAIQLFGDCRLVQRTIKDVNRLVPTIHATSLWTWVTRRGAWGAE